MSEMGMAMMGSAIASGPDRARIAAEQAVASPLLEDVNLANARGVLVNITANHSFKMKEYYDVMNTIKEFTAEDATVIVGNVFDDAMEDNLRVTMVATGLNGIAGRRAQKPELKIMTQVRDGTTGQPVFSGSAAMATGSTSVADEGMGMLSSNSRRTTVETMRSSGIEEYDIPAFLRKQAD